MLEEGKTIGKIKSIIFPSGKFDGTEEVVSSEQPIVEWLVRFTVLPLKTIN